MSVQYRGRCRQAPYETHTGCIARLLNGEALKKIQNGRALQMQIARVTGIPHAEQTHAQCRRLAYALHTRQTRMCSSTVSLTRAG